MPAMFHRHPLSKNTTLRSIGIAGLILFILLPILFFRFPPLGFLRLLLFDFSLNPSQPVNNRDKVNKARNKMVQ
ncbi:hypothetical protein [Bacteroides pyogenes]|uniref:Transmembrane protein n=1 Tax=Bacteroides pyogenes TaxID=310300 RepID=A0A5D3FL85_9BACE|nr:hypothetical protein [Bacteroides pyogenes]TYK33549.1 hypothetical protein FNJ60_08170 [Bacteroides pyogenes]TYK48676.1 hypothetical protein FNG97_06590 [Bacteroides pyogenes]